jgi:predicted ATPase
LDFANSTGDQFWAPELHRLKGDLILTQKDAEQSAEGSYHQAILLARQQSSKLLELRASVSLARLWHKQGKGIEAHQMLFEVYGWFTEGFDTADLREAKALLAG